MTVLAVAAMSARSLAEAARADGFEVIALDVFGDQDTRLAAQAWHGIGDASSLRVDPCRTLAALRELARRGGVAGWVAGSGFDGMPFVLAHGARLLPFYGTPVAALRRVRDAGIFFEALQRLGIGHPAVSVLRPDDPTGWLRKDMGGSGGWHIRDATDPAAASSLTGGAIYFQRRSNGRPMSATFIADGSHALLLGVNELTVRPLGRRPFVYAGAIGPLPVAPVVAAQVERAVRLLTAEFGLRGLASVDFMLEGDAVQVLEVNARPPGSLALYGGCLPGGWMQAHVAACRDGLLPAQVLAAPDVRGVETVFAPRDRTVDEALAQALASLPDVHDLPAAGTAFRAGDPVCSFAARGPSAAAVRATLDVRRGELGALWEQEFETTMEASP